MRGQLRDYALPDLLQFLHSLRKHGHLVIERPAPEDGSTSLAGTSAGLYFRDGQIVHAYCPPLIGDAVVATLLHWDDGRFLFLPGVNAPATSVGTDMHTLLLDGLRQLDEYRATLQRLPSPGAILHRDYDRERLGDCLLTLHEWELLARIDGQRRIADLIALTPGAEAATALRLRGLLDRDLVATEERLDFLANIVLARTPAAADVMTLTDDATDLLEALDGERTLLDLLQVTRLPSHHVISAARALVAAGLASVADGYAWYRRYLG